jgi:hypothetical protein
MTTLTNVRMSSIDKMTSTTNEKLEKKVVGKHGFDPAKHENWHFSPWMQKHLE